MLRSSFFFFFHFVHQVFDFEPSPPRRRGSPVILKNKPAPLRPAIFSNLRHNQMNQRQSQEHNEHQESSTVSPKHTVEVRALISSADSARRLSQGKEGHQKVTVDGHHHRQYYNGPQESVAVRPVHKVCKLVKIFDVSSQARGYPLIPFASRHSSM